MPTKQFFQKKSSEYLKNIPQFSLEDLSWLNSRGASTQDVALDDYGRKYFKDYNMPFSGQSYEKKYGRTYLPIVYLKKITDTPAMKLDVITNQLYELY